LPAVTGKNPSFTTACVKTGETGKNNVLRITQRITRCNSLYSKELAPPPPPLHVA
jgi:hypothetical protein